MIAPWSFEHIHVCSQEIEEISNCAFECDYHYYNGRYAMTKKKKKKKKKADLTTVLHIRELPHFI